MAMNNTTARAFWSDKTTDMTAMYDLSIKLAPCVDYLVHLCSLSSSFKEPVAFRGTLGV